MIACSYCFSWTSWQRDTDNWLQQCSLNKSKVYTQPKCYWANGVSSTARSPVIMIDCCFDALFLPFFCMAFYEIVRQILRQVTNNIPICKYKFKLKQSTSCTLVWSACCWCAVNVLSPPITCVLISNLLWWWGKRAPELFTGQVWPDTPSQQHFSIPHSMLGIWYIPQTMFGFQCLNIWYVHMVTLWVTSYSSLSYVLIWHYFFLLQSFI